MSEIQIQHIELDDSDRYEEYSRKLPGPIEIIEDDNVNRVVSLKKPTLAELGAKLVIGRRGTHGPNLSVRGRVSSAKSDRQGRKGSV